MPKAIDLRLPGISFEDALRKMLHTPPMPSSKSAKKAAAKKSKRGKG
jgi:hypothetical protein